MNLSFSLPSLSPLYKERIFPLILPSLLPLTSVTLSGSVYCVIALALERYLHLSRPHVSNKVWRIRYLFVPGYYGYFITLIPNFIIPNSPLAFLPPFSFVFKNFWWKASYICMNSWCKSKAHFIVDARYLIIKHIYVLVYKKITFQGSFFGYILPVLAFSVLYYGPKFFEFTTEYRLNEHRLVQLGYFCCHNYTSTERWCQVWELQSSGRMLTTAFMCLALTLYLWVSMSAFHFYLAMNR